MSMLLALGTALVASAAPQVVPLLDPDVELVVDASFDVAMDLVDRPFAVATRGGDTFVLVGGTTQPATTAGLTYVRAFDASGGILWQWEAPGFLEHPQSMFVPGVGQRVYVATRRTSTDGTQHGRVVTAIEDGAVVWRSDVSTQTSPLVQLAGSHDGSRLFVGTGAAGSVSRVASLSPSDGDVVWETPLGLGTVEFVAMAPDHAGNRIAVVVKGVGQFGNSMLVLDGADGALVATAPLPTALGAILPTTVAIDPAGTRVFAGTNAGSTGHPNLLAFDAASGALLFDATLPAHGGALAPQVRWLAFDPVVPGLHALIGSSQLLPRLYRLDPDSGDIEWDTTITTPSGTFAGTRVELSGQVLFAASAESGTLALAAFDRDTGDEMWSIVRDDPPAATASVRFAVDSASQTAVLASARPGGPTLDLRVDGFDLTLVDALWSDDLGTRATVPTALGLAVPPEGPHAFAHLGRPSGPFLGALDRVTGAVVWERKLPLDELPLSRVGATVAASADGAIVAAARTGVLPGTPGGLPTAGLEAFDGLTGQPLWTVSFIGQHGAPADVQVHDLGAGERVFTLHDSQGTTFGRTSMRSTVLSTGAWEWVTVYPEVAGQGTWRAATASVDVQANRVYGLIWRATPAEMRVVVRDAATGALLGDFPVSPGAFDTVAGAATAWNLARSADANAVFVAGEFHGSSGVAEKVVAARVTSSDGDIVWTRAIALAPASKLEGGELLHAAPTGALVLVVPVSQAGAPQVVLIGLDAATGGTLWTRTLGAGGATCVFGDAVLDPSGRVAIVGGRDGAGHATLFGIDAVTGTELWQLRADGGTEGDRFGALAAQGGRVHALVDTTERAADGRVHLVAIEHGALVSGPDAISIAAPEPAVFLLDRPASSAGRAYWVLGSASGTSPALPLGGVSLPLAFDGYTALSIEAANQPPFDATVGLLDAAGDARARLVLPPGLPSGLVGLVLHHAFVEITPSFDIVFASDALALLLGP